MGTGGTVQGVAEGVRGVLPEVRVHPVEPAESPTLSRGAHVGHHRIQAPRPAPSSSLNPLSAVRAAVVGVKGQV